MHYDWGSDNDVHKSNKNNTNNKEDVDKIDEGISNSNEDEEKSLHRLCPLKFPDGQGSFRMVAMLLDGTDEKDVNLNNDINIDYCEYILNADIKNKVNHLDEKKMKNSNSDKNNMTMI